MSSHKPLSVLASPSAFFPGVQTACGRHAAEAAAARFATRPAQPAGQAVVARASRGHRHRRLGCARRGAGECLLLRQEGGGGCSASPVRDGIRRRARSSPRAAPPERGRQPPPPAAGCWAHGGDREALPPARHTLARGFTRPPSPLLGPACRRAVWNCCGGRGRGRGVCPRRRRASRVPVGVPPEQPWKAHLPHGGASGSFHGRLGHRGHGRRVGNEVPVGKVCAWEWAWWGTCVAGMCSSRHQPSIPTRPVSATHQPPLCNPCCHTQAAHLFHRVVCDDHVDHPRWHGVGRVSPGSPGRLPPHPGHHTRFLRIQRRLHRGSRTQPPVGAARAVARSLQSLRRVDPSRVLSGFVPAARAARPSCPRSPRQHAIGPVAGFLVRRFIPLAERCLQQYGRQGMPHLR